MRFSASTLNTISKCGYRFYLEKVCGMEEGGKRKYNMLLGDIVADAIQAASLILHDKKEITDRDLQACLVAAYQNRYKEAGIPLDIMVGIQRLVFEGESDENLKAVDEWAYSINVSNYEFKPPQLKTGGASRSVKTPSLSITVVRSLETIYWYFSDVNPFKQWIRNAVLIQNEKQFEVPIAQPYTVWINDTESVIQDTVDGRFDTLLTFADDTHLVLEYKHVSTPYTQEFANNANQNRTYSLAIGGKGAVVLVDLRAEKFYTAAFTEQMRKEITLQYELARRIVQNNIYIPICATDPYTAGKTLCGFKCANGCPYGGVPGELDEEIAA